MRAMYSPSKLWLVITAKPRPRKYHVAGKTQLCQKGKIPGSGGSAAAPSSTLISKRSVGPISRTARYPAPAISHSAKRCRSEKRRAGRGSGGDAALAGDGTARFYLPNCRDAACCVSGCAGKTLRGRGDAARCVSTKNYAR